MNESFRKTRHRKRIGRCFELSFSYVLAEKNEAYLLVHAFCSARLIGAGHAWVENKKTGEVYDLVRNEIYPKEDYYKITMPMDINRYTFKEAAKKAVETDHSGPWDLQKC
jgi:hypothetical protein